MKTNTALSKEMNEILSVLKKETEMDKAIFDELPIEKKEHIGNKLALMEEIENGFITDVAKVKKWMELIELVYEWAIETETDIDIVHLLSFDEGKVQIQSIADNEDEDEDSDEFYIDDFEIDFVDGKLLINDEDLISWSFYNQSDDGEGTDSISMLMNAIEFNVSANKR